MIVKRYHHLAAVIGVYNADLVGGGEAALCAQTASGKDKTYVAVGYFEREARVYKNGFVRGNFDKITLADRV